ncbi:unnamed protein product, partial [marine sediment metagenome]
MMEFNYLFIEQKLGNFPPLELKSSILKKSAVIIPIKPTKSSYNIIFTSRP